MNELLSQVVPTAWQDEALARDGVSREVPCSALIECLHFPSLLLPLLALRKEVVNF